MIELLRDNTYFYKFKSLFHNLSLDIPILALFPLLLLGINNTWIFTPVSIDPWIYWGYFNNLGDMIRVFGDTYYVSRLPWIIPGYICYKLFPDLIANYILHLGFFYIAVFSLYFTVKIAIGRRSALVVSVLMGSYVFFLGAIGRDYVDGAGIAYMLLTILLLTIAIFNSRKTHLVFSVRRVEQNLVSMSFIDVQTTVLLIGAGITYTLAIFTNTILIVFLPVFILYFVILNHKNHKKNIPLSVISAGLGFIICTVLLCCINLIIGGSFFFFGPAVSAALTLIGSPNPWLIAGWAWLMDAKWLVLPFITILGGLAVLIIDRFRNKEQQPRNTQNNTAVYVLCLFLALLFFVILQWRGNPVLQLSYYASYLIPFVFLLLSSLVSPLLSKMSRVQFTWIMLGVIAMLSVSLLPTIRSIVSTNISIILPVVLVATGTAVIILFRYQTVVSQWISLSIFLILVTIGNFLFMGTNIWTDFNKDSELENLLLVVSESNRVFKEMETDFDVYFWYSAEETQGLAYVSITSTRLWSRRLINESFPYLNEYQLNPMTTRAASITPNTQIAILSNQQGVISRTNETLKNIGLYAEFLREVTIKQGSIDFRITFVNIRKS